MQWEWQENSILNSKSPHRSSREIFQAVCDELGRYYSDKGFKYTKSGRRLTYIDSIITLKINFWSSRSNTGGSSVALDILPYFYLTKSKGLEKKGLLFGHTIVTHKKPILPCKVEIIQINGESIIRDKEEWHEESYYKRIYNNYCDIYGIDIILFEKIINFIDNQIITVFNLIKTREGFDTFLNEVHKSTADWWLNDNDNDNLKIYFDLLDEV